MNEENLVVSPKIAAALVKAQKAFEPALKTSANPHFKSRYADLAACVEAVIGALNSAGIALIQKTYECPSGVLVETIFLHETGEYLSCGKLHVPASKQDAQGYGSALTYARRYSLMAACGIAPEDDDGNEASNQNKTKQKINQDQLDNLLNFSSKAGVDLENIKTFCKVEKLEEISIDDYQKIIKHLEKKTNSENKA